MVPVRFLITNSNLPAYYATVTHQLFFHMVRSFIILPVAQLLRLRHKLPADRQCLKVSQNYHNFGLVALGLWFTLSATPTPAQRFEPGGSLGLMSYTGDVVPNIRPGSIGVGLEGFLRYNFSPAVTIRGNLLFAFTNAEDANAADQMQQVRDVKFSSSVLEASLRMEYNFRDFRSQGERRRFSPYAFVGGGLSWITTDGNYVDKTLSTTPVIPFGVGFKYALPFNVNFGMELGARRMFTDEFDALTPDLLTTKYQSVNPHNNDMYYFLGISLSYTYDVGGICPIRFQ